MYLVEQPENTKGVYVILNISQKKAYIGLSINLNSRSKDHLAILQDNGSDNAQMLAEEQKNFWNFLVYISDSTKEEGLSNEINGFESLYIYLFSKFGFKLYNNKKYKSYLIGEDVNLPKMYSVFKRKYSAAFDYEELAVKELNSDFQKRFGIDFSAVQNMSEKELKLIFEKSIQRYAETHVEGLDFHYLNPQAKDFEEKYKHLCKTLFSPRISKNKAKNECQINWKEKSIFDEDLGLDKLVILSKFGSHSDENPYEILLKTSINISIPALGRSLWSFRRLNPKWVMHVAEEAGVTKNEPIYLILLYTASDVTSTKKIDKEKTFTKDVIIERDREVKENERDNPKFLWYYRQDKEGWQAIPDEHLYVSIPPTYETVRSFNITEFYFPKESFLPFELYSFFNSKAEAKGNTPWESQEASNTLKGSCSVTCARLKKNSDFHSLPNAERDLVSCVIAKLEYPYIYIH